MSTELERKAADLLVVRYGELWLKGRNRHEFERALVRNVKKALEPIAEVSVRRDHAQLVVAPTRRLDEVARRLEDVFGIASISPAWCCEPSAEAIARTAHTVMSEALAEMPGEDPIPFRVETRRSDKTFPMISMELDRYVADRVLPGLEERLSVNLRHPELTLGINVRTDRAYLFAERRAGAGGLPVGTLGRAICLLSGGIDSPVAAWMAMKRGCSVAFVSFHSEPYLGEPSRRKVIDLVTELSRYQPRNRLFVVPFTEIQIAIRDGAPEGYRTVLYRRMMHRLACRIARRERAGAIVTGESLGQVASQTLENLTCIAAASELPILRPLIAFDKSETIEVAKGIGTYDVSIRPEPDCCTVFPPRRPVIRGSLARCAAAEAELGVASLVERALEGVEIVDV